MFDLLPRWDPDDKCSDFYGSDTASVLELATKLNYLMNHAKLFETGMRQEFQDFIDVINIKYKAQENVIDDKTAAAQRAFAECIAEMLAVKDEFIADIDGAIEEALNGTY